MNSEQRIFLFDSACRQYRERTAIEQSCRIVLEIISEAMNFYFFGIEEYTLGYFFEDYKSFTSRRRCNFC